jgi:hypothetical protein
MSVILIFLPSRQQLYDKFVTVAKMEFLRVAKMEHNVKIVLTVPKVELKNEREEELKSGLQNRKARGSHN